MEHLMAIILAAGEGKRMKTKYSKVMHKVYGKPIIDWVLKSVEEAGFSERIIVVGHKADQIMDHVGSKVQYAVQEEQLGTGHAVIQAGKYLTGVEGCVFILNGDTPLISSETIQKTIKYHKAGGFAATVVTAELADPAGYGRIVRDSEDNLEKIVEHRDANENEINIKEVNSGMFCFNIKDLNTALKELKNDNDQGEYYLTDTLEILLKKGLKVGAVKVSEASEILGINDRIQLFEASEVMRDRTLKAFMRFGVTIMDPKTTYIDGQVIIGRDTVILPGTIIEGATAIGEDCNIGPNTRIVSSTLRDNISVSNSTILESNIESDAIIGPYAYIRPGSNIGRKVKIGDFVEIKNSKIGDKTKIPHLAYIGDSEIGRNCNIACGVITVNYNGKTKNKTKVGNNAFVGCNVNLVAPVEVKNDTYIAAGSTITDAVPEYSLAIARERQVIKEDWVNRKGMKRIEKD